MTRPAGYFIDANLLVLLVAGREDMGLIERHRRLRGYTPDDYRLLLRLATEAGRVLVTPNTLTEASNLLAQHGEPERSRLLARLAQLIRESDEVVVRSADASASDAYLRLGLTDAALVEAVSADAPVVTVDADLYLALLNRDPAAVVNFHHVREAAGDA